MWKGPPELCPFAQLSRPWQPLLAALLLPCKEGSQGGRGAWRAGDDAVTRTLPLLSRRPEPRAAQNGTFRRGAEAPGFGSDDTAPEGSLSPWAACRGRLWAAPLTWPPLPPWSRRAQNWPQTLLVPGTPHAQCQCLDTRNREPQTALACNPHTWPQRPLWIPSHPAPGKTRRPAQHPFPRQRGQRASLPPRGQRRQSQPRAYRGVPLPLPGGPATTSLSSCRGVG